MSKKIVLKEKPAFAKELRAGRNGLKVLHEIVDIMAFGKGIPDEIKVSGKKWKERIK